jgi:adenine-specific DNA-methyltransferase
MDGKSLDIAQDKLAQLKQILPEAFTEGKVDWEKLRLALGEQVSIQDECYVLNWAGKSEAFRALQTPTTTTLAPARDESVDFDATENIFIEGENPAVLKILQKAYYGQIKMIYIDPPYNTGNDSFVYPDKFSESRDEYLKRIQARDADGQLLKEDMFRPNSKDSGHYHSNWLSMIYPRLFLARNLLRDDGEIFVSIDNNEVHNLRLLLNDIFGEENFVECITWNKRIPKNDAGIGNIHEYILLYVKNATLKHTFAMPKDGLDKVYELVRKLERKKIPIAEAEAKLKIFFSKQGFDRGITLYNSLNEQYEIWGKINVNWPNTKTNGPRYDVLHPITKKPVAVPDRGWRWKKETFDDLLDYENVIQQHDGSYICGQIWFAKDEKTQPSLVKYLRDVENLLLRSIISLKSSGGMEVEKIFDIQSIFSNPKPTQLIRTLIESCTKDDDIILDFFSGSGSTAHALFNAELFEGRKRKFILVQYPETLDPEKKEHKPGNDFCIANGLPPNISEIGKERIRRVIQAIKEENPMFAGQNADLGFKVYKLRPSNFKLWRGDGIENAAELVEQLDFLEDPVREGAREENLLTELLLKSGYPLTAPLQKREAGAAHYYLVGGKLAAALGALDENLIRDVIQQGVQQFICLDRSFAANDPLKTNARLQLEDAGIAFHSI